MAARVHEDRACRPGQLAPISGIYKVVHLRHRANHEVVAIGGEEFPPCRTCQASVRFYLKHVASHMTHDLDLTGPLSLSFADAPKGRVRAMGKRAG